MTVKWLKKADLSKEIADESLVVFFSEPGAMGDAGKVIAVVRGGEAYGLSYINGDISYDDVLEYFPMLGCCAFGCGGIVTANADGWKSVYIAVGNHLFVSERVYGEFSKIMGEDVSPQKLFRDWHAVATHLAAKYKAE